MNILIKMNKPIDKIKSKQFQMILIDNPCK